MLPEATTTPMDECPKLGGRHCRRDDRSWVAPAAARRAWRPEQSGEQAWPGSGDFDRIIRSFSRTHQASGRGQGIRPHSSRRRPILYGPDRVASGRPFQLSRTSPSRSNSSIAAWTAGIASRQSVAIMRATSLGQIVASGSRCASRVSVAALGSVMRTTSASHSTRSSHARQVSPIIPESHTAI